MKPDRYTKAVLTVIALALVSLAINQAMPKAKAFGENNCGLNYSPCHIVIDNFRDLGAIPFLTR